MRVSGHRLKGDKIPKVSYLIHLYGVQGYSHLTRIGYCNNLSDDMTERKRDLLLRLEDVFNPKLSQIEIDRRRNDTDRIIRMFSRHADWLEHIKEAYLYGSMVYGEPRTNSDVDVALITFSSSVWNDDPRGSYLIINGVFHYYREKLKIPYFKVDCAICPEHLFDHPENEPEGKNRQIYLDIRNRGNKIF